MNTFSNLKVATKLGLGFGILLMLALMQGVVAIFDLSKVHDLANELESKWLPSVMHASDMNTNTSDFRIAEIQHISSNTEEEMEKYEQDIASVAAVLDRNRLAFEKGISSPEEQALYNSFKGKWDAYLKEHARVIELSRQNRSEEAQAISRGEARSCLTH